MEVRIIVSIIWRETTDNVEITRYMVQLGDCITQALHWYPVGSLHYWCVLVLCVVSIILYNSLDLL